jgi:hypothetical protein
MERQEDKVKKLLEKFVGYVIATPLSLVQSI